MKDHPCLCVLQIYKILEKTLTERRAKQYKNINTKHNDNKRAGKVSNSSRNPRKTVKD